MKLFKDKYRTESRRLQSWNYNWNGSYFITICTKNRECFFGKIRKNIMGLNKIGIMVAKFWQEIPNHFSNIKLDEWIIMPNHIHGILVLKNDKNPVETLHCNVSTGFQKSFYSKISPKPKSVSTVIRSFKSVCTREINKNFPYKNFGWQPRFYDHIIRNKKSFERIKNYIKFNPQKWDEDSNNTY